MRFVGRCYRGHDPAWSFAPLSGEGAALRGGRFNRPGEATLYLSLDIVTAVGECTQGLTLRLQPLVICEYDVDCDPVADLRDDVAARGHGVDPTDLACPWLSQMLARHEASSGRVKDRLAAGGFCGALVPSFAPGATRHNVNLVLWRWGPDLPHRVAVFDPTGRLPKDQLSWTTPST